MSAGLIWYDVKARGVAESNLFLRAFWAALRQRVGSHAWAFMPSKDGHRQTVTFGRASFPQLGVVGFGISYARRGVIDQLWVRPEAGTENLLPEIAASIRDAKGASQLQPAWINAEIAVFPPVNMARYASDHLSLKGLARGAICLRLYVSGYDTPDREDEFLAIAEPILNALSVFTNCSFRYGPLPVREEVVELVNDRWAQVDWIDGSPIVDGRLAITPEQLRYLEGLAVAPGDDHVIRAARLFHQALHLDYGRDPTLTDAVRTLYVSALEAASAQETNPLKCEGCGQPIYAIRKRVREVARRHLGEAAEGIIDRAYKARSGYLHTGSVFGKRPFGLGIRPLLDPDASSGCYLPHGLDNTVTVREFTSFILREVARKQGLETTPP
ncbi:hypothetical protein RZN05_19600 [Sphingomonas sp. HF-S4]|uniref:Apea-like HEPN domain-containing protein n=1 Tax=Sphingomonas agrestis TaxID=3080540 RepID=A0ABU3YCU8_9SPHN|nr:hypothetical protein [Sphingomonas sp. HF-S4]MDV3459211.1 hypothetical protein [Sphingomonas sp. HF-S4]